MAAVHAPPRISSFEQTKATVLRYAEKTWAKVERVVEAHFALISFIFSCALLLICSPASFIFGVGLGALAHYYFKPDLRLHGNERVIPLVNTSFAIVGAMATLLRFTPAGASAGLVFQSIPFLSSLVIGSTAYRIGSSFRP